MGGVPDLAAFTRSVLRERGWDDRAATTSMLRYAMDQESVWGTLITAAGGLLAEHLRQLIETDPGAALRLKQALAGGSISLDGYYRLAFEMHECDDTWGDHVRRAAAEWLEQARPLLGASAEENPVGDPLKDTVAVT